MWDCPWYADTAAGLCVSDMLGEDQTQIYRTANDCCTAEFSGSASCVTDSKNPTVVVKPSYYYPDQHNKGSCVFSSLYDDWMNATGYSEYYLFTDGAACCSLWFPESTNCPDTSAATPEDTVNGASVVSNYFYPDSELNNCGYGRDYPLWMGGEGYARSYLFTTPAGCCNKFYPGKTDCPAETTPQEGYYWESYFPDVPIGVPIPPGEISTIYYPDQASGTCIGGTDYPEWMGGQGFSKLYLYDTLEGCCTYWYGEGGLASCVGSAIMRPTTPSGTGATTTAAVWYPQLSAKACANDGNMPSWMTGSGFSDAYTFVTEGECCKAWGYECPNAFPTTTVAPFPNGGSGVWYPVFSESTCVDDSSMPAYMMLPEYSPYYNFGSQAACCGQFGFSGCA
jgi:insulin receptor substrate 1